MLIIIIPLLILTVGYAVKFTHPCKFEIFEPLILTGFLSSLISLGAGTIVYTSHANDMGIIQEYSRVVSVYEANIEDLTERLNSLKAQQSSLLNSDKPVAALTESISKAVAELTQAKAKIAQAYVSIVQRKNGLYGFMVSYEDLKTLR